MTKQNDFGDFRAKMATAQALLETRDANTPDIAEIGRTIDKIGRAFEEYKSANDTRIGEIAKKGAVDPLVEEKLKKIDEALDQLAEQKKTLEKVETRLARPGDQGGSNGASESQEAVEYRKAFVNWMRSPQDPQRNMNLRTAQQALEARAAQVVTSTGSAGGFALPEQIESTIARLTLDISPIRQLATVRQVSTSDYKELFDIGGNSSEWLGEAATRNLTTTNDLAEVAPTMGTLSSRARASEESLDDLFFDVEGWMALTVAEAHAAAEGAAFIGGNGTNRPTGFLAGPTPVVAPDAGRAFGTLQFRASGQAAAMPTSADTFYDMVYDLRARYRPNATWVAARAVLSTLRKYKDTTNQYLWQPSLVIGQPESFMGYRVVEAEDMPAVAANAFPLAFGDFREGYLIVDRVGQRATRDDITLPGFVTWYIRRRVGGRIRNSQAIKLLRISV